MRCVNEAVARPWMLFPFRPQSFLANWIFSAAAARKNAKNLGKPKEAEIAHCLAWKGSVPSLHYYRGIFSPIHPSGCRIRRFIDASRAHGRSLRDGISLGGTIDSYPAIRDCFAQLNNHP